MIKTESLYYLAKVEQYESISMAAKEIHVTPSAITHSLKQLSDELGGLTLYTRTSKGIHLTEEGRIIAAVATQIINEISYIYTLSNNFSSHATQAPYIGQHLILCANHMFSETLTYLCIEMHKKYHDVDFNLIVCGVKKMLSSVNQDEETFGIFYGVEPLDELFASYPNVRYQVIGHSAFHVRAAINSKIMPDKASELTWKQLSHLPIALTSTATYLQDCYIDKLKQYNPDFSATITASTNNMYMKIIEEDLAVGIVPNLRITSEQSSTTDPSFRSIPLRGNDLHTSLVFVYNKDALNDAVKFLIYELKQNLIS